MIWAAFTPPPTSDAVSPKGVFLSPWVVWFNEVWNKLNAINNAVFAAAPVDIGIWVVGLPSASEKILNFVSDRALTFPKNLAGSVAKAQTASTGTAVWNINKNGGNVGTLTFTASATGVFAMASAMTLAIGDILNVVAPTSQDATLADISITLACTRAT